MKNADTWTPTKFEKTPEGSWRSSRSTVSIRSRVVADRAVATYQSAIERFASGRILDLGCGTVPLYGLYEPKTTDVVCVDWPSSLHHNEHIDIFADLNILLHEVEEASFATVIASDVIEHLHTPHALFQTAAHALSSGGHLILGVPFLYWVHEQPHDYHRYTKFALQYYCKESGLEVLEITPWAGAPEVIVDLIGKALGPWPWVASVAVRTGIATISLGLVKKLSRASMATMPLGYTLVAQKAAGHSS